jgi:hypothetical protein
VVEQTGADVLLAAELGSTAFAAQEFLNYLTLEF